MAKKKPAARKISTAKRGAKSKSASKVRKLTTEARRKKAPKPRTEPEVDEIFGGGFAG